MFGVRHGRENVEKAEFTPSMLGEMRPSFSSAASGYLEKKASAAPYLWQKRFFVATGKYMRYYQTEACEQLLAAIDLRGSSAVAEGMRVIRLSLASSEKILLRAKDEEQRDEWLAALEILRRTLETEQSNIAMAPTSQPENAVDIRYNVSPIPRLNAELGSRREGVTKLKGRTTSEESVRESMIATPRNSFPACAAGFMQKKATSIVLAGWQTRFFVACGHYLRYYASDEAGADLLCAIDLNAVAVKGAGVDDPTDTTSREFVLDLADGEIRLRAASPTERAQWVSSLLEMQRQVKHRSRDKAHHNSVTFSTASREQDDDHSQHPSCALAYPIVDPTDDPEHRHVGTDQSQSASTPNSTTMRQAAALRSTAPPSTTADNPPPPGSSTNSAPRRRGCCSIFIF